MDKLSQHVKTAMLHYPSIFPNRISVLDHMFFVLGNGLEWTDDGILIDRFFDGGSVPEGQMDYSDLEGDQSVIAKYYSGDSYEPGGLLHDVRLKIEAENAEKRANREAIFSNIDVLASTPMPGVRRLGHYSQPQEIMRLIKSGYCLAKAPEYIEPSFARGIIEAIDSVLASAPKDQHSLELQKWQAEFMVKHLSSTEYFARIDASFAPAMEKLSASADQAIANLNANIDTVIPALMERNSKPGLESASLHAAVRASGAQPSKGITLREKSPFVAVLKDGVQVYRNRDYRGAAEWAKHQYALSDAELFAIYDDYKRDYDNEGDDE